MDLKDIDRPTVAIVAMRSQCDAKEQMPAMHLPYYQVTIDPRRCNGDTNGYSPTRTFMRFGRAPGDELQGWQPAHEIEVYEILADFREGETIYPNVTGSAGKAIAQSFDSSAVENATLCEVKSALP